MTHKSWLILRDSYQFQPLPVSLTQSKTCPVQFWKPCFEISWSASPSIADTSETWWPRKMKIFDTVLLSDFERLKVRWEENSRVRRINNLKHSLKIDDMARLSFFSAPFQAVARLTRHFDVKNRLINCYCDSAIKSRLFFCTFSRDSLGL